MINRQPILENELIFIRPMTPGDKESLYQVAKDPLIWKLHHVKRYQREVFEDFFIESINSGGGLIIIDKRTSQIIGSSRYQHVPDFPEGIEIGWTFLDRSYWGGYYNGVIKRMMISHAFQYVDHIILNINQCNLRSQRAAEKIGARKLKEAEWTQIPRKNPETLVYLVSKF